MGFSITSAVFGGIIIVCYSVMIAIASYFEESYFYGYDYDYQGRYRSYKWFPYNTKMAISIVVLILGICEFALGIWAAICICLMRPCCDPYQVSLPHTFTLFGFLTHSTCIVCS